MEQLELFPWLTLRCLRLCHQPRGSTGDVERPLPFPRVASAGNWGLAQRLQGLATCLWLSFLKAFLEMKVLALAARAVAGGPFLPQADHQAAVGIKIRAESCQARCWGEEDG